MNITSELQQYLAGITITKMFRKACENLEQMHKLFIADEITYKIIYDYTIAVLHSQYCYEFAVEIMSAMNFQKFPEETSQRMLTELLLNTKERNDNVMEFFNTHMELLEISKDDVERIKTIYRADFEDYKRPLIRTVNTAQEGRKRRTPQNN